MMERMRNNPKGGWRFQQVDSLLRYYEFECRPGSKHSHFIYLHNLLSREVVIVYRGKELKPFYVGRALEAIEEVIMRRENENDEV